MVNRRSVPTPDEVMPKAASVIDEPIMAVWDGTRCGPKNGVKTVHGERDGFAVRVVTRKEDKGRILFFWSAVVLQLAAALKMDGDAAFITIHREGRKYTATEISDDVTVDELITVYEATRPDDADAPADDEPDEGSDAETDN
jgi:hypothetical protein